MKNFGLMSEIATSEGIYVTEKDGNRIPLFRER